MRPVIFDMERKIQTLERRARRLQDKIRGGHGSVKALEYDRLEEDALQAALETMHWYQSTLREERVRRSRYGEQIQSQEKD